ncbi:MAG: phenylpropionate dioxygenase-like ring-hydroxylating dioxygenase large terminal subunit [Myxococcota bacterium]|jgi:phenylpropionate dioxygenase-like ring-hydroxylating dioxygenase large terminal subunit
MSNESSTPAREGASQSGGATERSSGISYQALLDSDTRTVPEVLRMESVPELPVAQVPIERYTSQAFHDLEVEKLWKRVWQVACREEEIPEPGDHMVYEIAGLEALVVRGADNAIRAFANTCLHRGRALKDRPGRSEDLRCPFHGWTWNLDGSLKSLPCRWDFPHVDRNDYTLPEFKTGSWGGFVFINMSPDAESFESFIGDLPNHFDRWPLENRYKEAHVAHKLRCNWKVAQEGFMEAYHVIATHPQMLSGIGDSNSQYDAWDNFSRAITPNMTPSPHLDYQPSEQEMLQAMITTSLDAEPPIRVPENMTARQLMAQMSRMQLQALVPSVTHLSDAELNDSFYYTVFPNFHPWGAYNRINYRFRPYGNDPNCSVMEVIYLTPFRGKRPPPAEVHWLDFDDPWTEAPELGPLCKIFDQDTFNLPEVQRGLKNARHSHVTFSSYQETKIRHFHGLLDEYLAR